MDALKQLQTAYKLNLNTISEALSVTPFEVTAPRFLSNSGAHTVVDNELSYVTHISSFNKWNDSSSNYKFRLKKELERFRRSHLTTIREQIPMKSPLYHLATSSLIKFIVGAMGLINYIDVTHDKYSAGKFGIDKAWYVTTKLVMVLITEVGKPRKGTLHSFEASDGISIAKVIFYCVLKSLNVMAEITAVDCRDSPVVSMKLVKFLSLNTSVKIMDKLEILTGALLNTIKNINKKLGISLKLSIV